MPDQIVQKNALVSRDGRKWTRDETILALGLYFQLPWGRMHYRSREIVELAQKMGRTSSSLAMKLTNIGRCDPTLVDRGVGGLAHGGKLEKMLWHEFAEHRDLLAMEFDRCLKAIGSDPVLETDDSIIKTPQGLDGVRLSRYRINQSFFRGAVLAAYGNACCITGICDRRLLIASHIRPWSKCEDGNDRTDVRNGLCLNALYDRAFDKGLITIDTDYRMVLSSSLKGALNLSTYDEYFKRFEGCRISVPDRSKPLRKFLQYHNENIFLA